MMNHLISDMASPLHLSIDAWNTWMLMKTGPRHRLVDPTQLACRANARNCDGLGEESDPCSHYQQRDTQSPLGEGSHFSNNTWQTLTQRFAIGVLTHGATMPVRKHGIYEPLTDPNTSFFTTLPAGAHPFLDLVFDVNDLVADLIQVRINALWNPIGKELLWQYRYICMNPLYDIGLNGTHVVMKSWRLVVELFWFWNVAAVIC